MGKCRLWVNVAMGICRMGICRMGICRLTVRKQVLTTCRVLNELTVREGGGVVLLPRSPSDARRRPCLLGQLPWCRWNGSALLDTFTFTKLSKIHYLYYIWTKSWPGSHPRHQKLLLRLSGSQDNPRHLRQVVINAQCMVRWRRKDEVWNDYMMTYLPFTLSARARGSRWPQVGLSKEQ